MLFSQTVGIVPSLCSDDASCVYAYGMNSQVVMGRVSKKREREEKGHGIRADSRWLGMGCNETDCEGDTVWGVTAAGSLYIVRNAEGLFKSVCCEDEQEE